MRRNQRLAVLPVLALLFAGCSGSSSDRGATPPVTQPADASSSDDQGFDTALDRAVAEHWRTQGVQPVALASDTEFARRATLDLIGRIPTTEEVAAFVASTDPNKRAALVDGLLARDAWAEHWSEVLATTMLGGAAQQRPREREGFESWLEQQLIEGRPWDALVSEMLTIEGESDVVGPAGFVTTHGRKNRVEALTGQTARVFLGLQLQCAQCHDDPDDRFTQAQFYGLAAYYARTKIRSKKVEGGGRVAIVVDRPRGEMRLPTENDAPGDRTGDRVSPQFPLLRAQARAEQTRRQALADGIIGSDLFAKAAANHAWAQLLGRGIVEPWDDLGGVDTGPHPVMLETLAEQFRADGYDLRALLRSIALSTAYQRSSAGPLDRTAVREQAFAQAQVRPLGASALMRSLLVATGLDDVSGRAFRRQVDRRRQQLRKDYEMAFDDDEMAAAHRVHANVPQALLLLNGELTNQAVTAPTGAVAQIIAEHAEPADRVDALYARVLGRPPTATQREALLTTLGTATTDDRAYQDLAHAMLVSSEFVTNH